jgi:hypothetical protein
MSELARNMWKKVTQSVRYFCNVQKTAQRKHSPNRRIFAPSGHPAFQKVYQKPKQQNQPAVRRRRRERKPKTPTALCSAIDGRVFNQPICHRWKHVIKKFAPA